MWLECGWNVVGMVGIWSEFGWNLVGLVFGRNLVGMVGIWSEFGRNGRNLVGSARNVWLRVKYWERGNRCHLDFR